MIIPILIIHHQFFTSVSNYIPSRGLFHSLGELRLFSTTQTVQTILRRRSRRLLPSARCRHCRRLSSSILLMHGNSSVTICSAEKSAQLSSIHMVLSGAWSSIMSQIHITVTVNKINIITFSPRNKLPTLVWARVHCAGGAPLFETSAP